MKKVSVIVPTKNSAQFLEKCLYSIKKQTYSNIEIIVVDNYSEDSTKDISLRFTSLFFEKGPERSAQRNYGVSQSGGDYVLIVDSDMVLTEKVIADCVELMDSNDLISGVVIPEESIGEGFWAHCKKLERSFYIDNDDIEAARFFKKQDYQKIGGYDEGMVSGEDWDLSQRVSKLGIVARIKSLIYHNEGKINLTKTLKKKIYYAKLSGAYLEKNNLVSDSSKVFEVFKRFKLYLSQPSILFKNPIVGIGMLYMKICEYGFGYLGMKLIKKNMKTVIIPEKLIIEVNKKVNFLNYFSLGECVGKVAFEENKEEFKFKINIVPNPEVYFEAEMEDYSTFYKVGKTTIFYQRKYAIFNCKLLVKNLGTPEVTVYVNQAYLRFVLLKMDNVYPLGIHLTDIFLVNFLKRKDLVLHGASMHNNTTNDSFLLIAPPDTGKTYTSYMLIKKGYKYLGEDLSFYSKEEDSLFCMPMTSTWGHRFSFSLLDLSKIPFLGLFFTQNKKNVIDIFGKDSVVPKSKLSRIYLLSKSETNHIEKINYTEDLFREILAIQRNEFSYFKNPLLRVAEYFNLIKVDDIYGIEADSLKELLMSKVIYKVYATNHDQFHEIINKNELEYSAK